jgi:hypothetical protein
MYPVLFNGTFSPMSPNWHCGYLMSDDGLILSPVCCRTFVMETSQGKIQKIYVAPGPCPHLHSNAASGRYP